MDTSQFIRDNEKLEFRQIVLGHIKKILEISSHELRDGTHITNHGNYSETITEEDTRYSYIQAIENLAYVLIPYFDKQMQDVFDECIGIINAYGFQIRNAYKEEFEGLCKDVGEANIT